jgi:hypothetical protein
MVITLNILVRRIGPPHFFPLTGGLTLAALKLNVKAANLNSIIHKELFLVKQAIVT